MKIGQIFNSEEYGFNYAKCPHAVVFENYIRVYFIHCLSDGCKLVSEVAYVDYSLDFSKVLRVSSEPVISRGNIGCFDEHGIYPISVFEDDGKLYSYYTGLTRRVSVSLDTGIGLAVSEDGGKTFQKMGNGPVLAASLHEPFMVCDGFVRKYGGVYYMWYIYGVKWTKKNDADPAERTYVISFATSENGIDWVKSGRKLIPDKLENECQALPMVERYKGKYVMVFCYRSTFDFRTKVESSYRLGMAYSTDLQNWTRDDESLVISRGVDDWDSGMMCYPYLLWVGETLYLLYNGNDFGRKGFGLAKIL